MTKPLHLAQLACKVLAGLQRSVDRWPSAKQVLVGVQVQSPTSERSSSDDGLTESKQPHARAFQLPARELLDDV